MGIILLMMGGVAHFVPTVKGIYQCVYYYGRNQNELKKVI